MYCFFGGAGDIQRLALAWRKRCHFALELAAVLAPDIRRGDDEINRTELLSINVILTTTGIYTS